MSKKLGRKPYPREVRDRLLDNLREGMSIVAACTQAGISENTYYRWLDECQDGEWTEEVDAAKDFAEAVALSKLKRLGDEKADWRAYAWILERRYPDRWGAKKELELNVGSTSDKGTEMVASMISQVQEQLSPRDDEDEDITQDADD
jgi:transposase-like protein